MRRSDADPSAPAPAGRKRLGLSVFVFLHVKDMFSRIAPAAIACAAAS